MDYDRDGHLDLFVSHYIDFDLVTAPVPGGLIGLANRKAFPSPVVHEDSRRDSALLYHNNGDGTFSEVTKQAGITNQDRATE